MRWFVFASVVVLEPCVGSPPQPAHRLALRTIAVAALAMLPFSGMWEVYARRDASFSKADAHANTVLLELQYRTVS